MDDLSRGGVDVRGPCLALSRTRGVMRSRPRSTSLRRFCHISLLRPLQHRRHRWDGGLRKPRTIAMPRNMEISPQYLGTRIKGA